MVIGRNEYKPWVAFLLRKTLKNWKCFQTRNWCKYKQLQHISGTNSRQQWHRYFEVILKSKQADKQTAQITNKIYFKKNNF